ncbi:hypothetical protein GCM10009849_23300 [Sinomonas flava]|uniref:Uncharacterized protein n=1 Tax=Sinomonas flava TaxID=496857 RepID=A0ABP5NRT3_9MICC
MGLLGMGSVALERSLSSVTGGMYDGGVYFGRSGWLSPDSPGRAPGAAGPPEATGPASCAPEAS